jgi:predicted porin
MGKPINKKIYSLKLLYPISLFIIFLVLPLKADENRNLSSDHDLIPDVPDFSITYQDDTLICSPTGVIETKTHNDLVSYECQKRYFEHEIEKKEEDARGVVETQRLKSEVKQKTAKGAIYSVEIPLKDANSPTRARIIAQQQLKHGSYGQYVRIFLPAKLYMSIRPQFVNNGDDNKMKLQDGGSRAGFYYYYQLNNDLELMFQYEAGIDWDEETPFINLSDTSNTNRRLSYFALKYRDSNLIVGKYWSAYYDIAGFTDRFMTYGAQAGGAFNFESSGTGRADKMVQIRTEKDVYNITLQAQFKHDTLNDLNTDYDYTAAGSLVYSGMEGFKLGAAMNYGRFDEITTKMQSVGIDGDDFSSIIGLTYTKNTLGLSTVLSYTQNHMSDDQGTYFDGLGAELYMSYDIDDGVRVAGGGNWLFPEDSDYAGKFSIKNLIFSFQYTFGEKTFDDLVYVEVSLPNGRFANGESKDNRLAIGLRYLLDY